MTTMPNWLLPFLGAAVLGLGAASAWLVGHALPARGAPADDAGAGQGAAGAGTTARGWRWALALGLPLAVVALYAALGHPRALDPAQRQRPADPSTMVDRLAGRLAGGQGSAADWAMLGRSYRVLGRHAEAATAYERAAPLLPDDADLLADWIESRMLAAGRRFDERSLALLAQAARLAPQHPGVLMLSGLAALQGGDLPGARRAFTALRAQQPEGSPDRAALDRALAELAAGRDPRVSAPASASR